MQGIARVCLRNDTATEQETAEPMPCESVIAPRM